MADYYTVVELIKYFELDNNKLMIYNSFTYSYKIKTESSYSSYFTDVYEAVDNTGKETLNIKSLVVSSDDFYSRQLSLTDCVDNERSFYFNITEQMLYVHFDHDVNPYSVLVEYGKVFGFTSDKPRNFNGIDYDPEIISIPRLRIKVDALKYTQQGFMPADVVLNNNPVIMSDNPSGPFDDNREFTGNDIFIYIGMDDFKYDDLILVTNNYIVNTVISYNRVIVKTKDKREQQSKSIPQDTYNNTDFPNIEDDYLGDIKQDAYGKCFGIQGICVNGKSTGNKTFYFASVITVDSPYPLFYVKRDEKIQSISPSATDYTNGMATFAVADIHVDGDNTKGILDVMCSGIFRNYNNPADIIADLNLRFLDIVYNNSNYNTTEWEDEKQYLENVGLFINEEKELYKWIEKLQSGSTVGFQYFFDQGKRTIRLDNPNRDAVKEILDVDVLNDLEFDNNFDFYATHAVVFSENNYYTDYKTRYRNNDYYEETFKQHRKEKQFSIDTLLPIAVNAIKKSYIIMEDLKKERPTGKILLGGIEYFSLRLFDIITVDTDDNLSERIITIDNYIKTDDSETIMVKTDHEDIDLYVKKDYESTTEYIKSRIFLGVLRMQIIGITPNIDNGTVELEVRQRDYSDVYNTMTGYL